jgi:DNA-binding PadR family transcriptional regulator
VLELAILGLLQQSPMHGYELRKELAQVLGGLRSISFGSLYPALKRLHAAGLITTDDPAPEALPADAPPLAGRRGKVVYTITAEGKERFQELVSQTGPEAYDDGRLFGVHLAFFRHTAADARLRILEGRRRTVESQREGLRASLARTRERLDRYTLELTSPSHRPRVRPRPRPARSRRAGPESPTGASRPPVEHVVQVVQVVQGPHRSETGPVWVRKKGSSWDPSRSPSSGSATAPPPSCRACTTTGTPTSRRPSRA